MPCLSHLQARQSTAGQNEIIIAAPAPAAKPVVADPHGSGPLVYAPALDDSDKRTVCHKTAARAVAAACDSRFMRIDAHTQQQHALSISYVCSNPPKHNLAYIYLHRSAQGPFSIDAHTQRQHALSIPYLLIYPPKHNPPHAYRTISADSLMGPSDAALYDNMLSPCPPYY